LLPLDFEATHENAGDDPIRQRMAILTKKVGAPFFPLALVYANHSEFLTGTDDRSSLNIGLTFDLGAGRRGQ
jgi:hypothetical protein